jgi:hypothetical protein
MVFKLTANQKLVILPYALDGLVNQQSEEASLQAAPGAQTASQGPGGGLADRGATSPGLAKFRKDYRFRGLLPLSPKKGAPYLCGCLEGARSKR